MSLEIAGIAVQAITALAIVFAGWQLLYHSRAMHRELEMAYVGRYWQLMDSRSTQFVVTDEPEIADTALMVRYLQLCEDEIELRQLGRVTDATWGFWAAAIHDQVSSDAYRTVLESLSAERYDHLRRLLSDGPQHDPLRLSWIKRRLRGL